MAGERKTIYPPFTELNGKPYLLLLFRPDSVGTVVFPKTRFLVACRLLQAALNLLGRGGIHSSL